MAVRGTEAVQRISGSSSICAESTPSLIGLITPDTKQTGKRSAGKPHAAFDVAGAGNVTMVAGLRSTTKVMELPPAPTVRAPALDPTLWGRAGNGPNHVSGTAPVPYPAAEIRRVPRTRYYPKRSMRVDLPQRESIQLIRFSPQRPDRAVFRPNRARW